jgi:hypothetical protein
MHKFLIGLAAAASAVTMAAPASAQVWAPPVYNYNPYNYGYGFNARGFAQTMQVRVQRMRNDVRVMEARRILSRGEARSLDRQARNLQDRIYRVSRYGVTPGEARSVENQIRRLEVRISREATDWNKRYGRHHRW